MTAAMLAGPPVFLAPGGWGAGYATAPPGGSKAVAGWFQERRGVAMGIRQTGLPWVGPWPRQPFRPRRPPGAGAGRSVGLSLTCAMTANQLGIVAGPPVFGLVLDIAGYPTAWWSLAVALALVAGARLRRLR